MKMKWEKLDNTLPPSPIALLKTASDTTILCLYEEGNRYYTISCGQFYFFHDISIPVPVITNALAAKYKHQVTHFTQEQEKQEKLAIVFQEVQEKIENQAQSIIRLLS